MNIDYNCGMESFAANYWNVLVVGPFNVAVGNAEVWSSGNPPRVMGNSSADGSLQIPLCGFHNMTALKNGLIFERTEFTGPKTITIIMRVFSTLLCNLQDFNL